MCVFYIDSQLNTKYYKINTGNSVLIRGNKNKSKKKNQEWDSNSYQNIIDTLTLNDPRSYYHDYDSKFDLFRILNIFNIKGKLLILRKKAYTFRIAIYNMFTYFDVVNGMCDLLT